MNDILPALVPLIVVLPLLAAAATLLLGGRPRVQSAVALAALSVVLVLACILWAGIADEGGVSVHVGGWAPPWGIVLVVDRLSALMIVVSATVLLAVLVFALSQGVADGARESPVSIFHPTYLMLATGLFTAFVAGDLFNLYVGFELLLAASYVLLTIGGSGARIRAGTTYIIVSIVSSFFFLTAIGLIYGATGTVNLAQVALRVAELPEGVRLLLHVALLMGFLIKAAAFPLSFWLPDSYPTAPAPVTAVFAGLLTKVGVYAIVRTETLLFPGTSLAIPLLAIGSLTLVVGILGALAQADLKRLLSFTLVSHIGYMLFGIGLDTALGYGAAIYYIAHHIVIQTALFLIAGLIERVGQSTSVTRLAGLAKAAPIVSILFFVAALNLGGLPPFSGFLGKIALFFAGAEAAPGASFAWLIWVGIAAGAATSLLTLYAVIRYFSLGFWRTPRERDEREPAAAAHLEEAPEVETSRRVSRTLPRGMVGSAAAMVVVSLGLTVFAGPIFAYTDRAGADLVDRDQYIELVYPGVEDPAGLYDQPAGENGGEES